VTDVTEKLGDGQDLLFPIIGEVIDDDAGDEELGA